MGAGGYKFSMYIVDDPDHPVAVVKDSIVDGTAVVCPWVEDTNYKVEIAALGNEKLNNTASVSATEISWSTLVAATLVPNGTDLTTYFGKRYRSCFRTGSRRDVLYFRRFELWRK